MLTKNLLFIFTFLSRRNKTYLFYTLKMLFWWRCEFQIKFTNIVFVKTGGWSLCLHFTNNQPHLSCFADRALQFTSSGNANDAVFWTNCPHRDYVLAALKNISRKKLSLSAALVMEDSVWLSMLEWGGGGRVAGLNLPFGTQNSRVSFLAKLMYLLLSLVPVNLSVHGKIIFRWALLTITGPRAYI